eukprot:304841_1
MGRGHIHLEKCFYEGKCVEEEGRRHQFNDYKPRSKTKKDELTHSKFWRRKKWNDPCVEKFRKRFDKCSFVCSHKIHAQRAANGEEDEDKYCTESLWHRPMATPTGHTFNCKHPFSGHVILLCDISSSMASEYQRSDVSPFDSEYAFIQNAPRLHNNRLAALYSAIHKFISLRLQQGGSDRVSAIMFNENCFEAVMQIKAEKDFVSNYLLKYTPVGGKSFQVAFEKAESLIDGTQYLTEDEQDTVLILLTDGEAPDNGASTIVAELSNKLGSRFQLFCILFGPDTPIIETICTAGKGKLLYSLSGIGNKLRCKTTANASNMWTYFDNKCNARCSLSQHEGCEYKCKLHYDHDTVELPCKCASEIHYCGRSCKLKTYNGVQCYSKCVLPYNHDKTAEPCKCRSDNHICDARCSKVTFNGYRCQSPCVLKYSHNKIKQPCKCDDVHICGKSCVISLCKNVCEIKDKGNHSDHICPGHRVDPKPVVHINSLIELHQNKIQAKLQYLKETLIWTTSLLVDDANWNHTFDVLNRSVQAKFTWLQNADFEILSWNKHKISNGEDLQALYNDAILIQKSHKFKITYQSQSTIWTPPNLNVYQDGKWNENFENLISCIETKFDVKKANIAEIQDPDE